MDQKQISDTEYDLIFTAEIEDGWWVYSQFIEEDGPVPTTFYYDEGDHFELIGQAKESGNIKKAYDKVFEMELIKFAKKGIITQRVTVSDASKPIAGYFEFMTCNDERCLPPTEVDFNFEFKASASTPEPKLTDAKEKTANEKANAQPEEQVAQKESQQADEAALVIEEADESIVLNEQDNGNLTPVIWSGEVIPGENDEFTVSFKATLQEGWNIYSQETAEDGPLPTYFEFEPADHYELIGKLQEKGKKKSGFDPIFEVNVVKYIDEPVYFTQKIKSSAPDQPITAFLTYMSCDDRQCIPFMGTAIWVSPKTGEVLIGAAAEQKIDAAIEPGKIAIMGDTLDSSVAAIRASYQTPVGNCGEENVTRDMSLIWTFIFGFAGGLLALLTPCVFPMIPLTVSFFTKSSKDRKSGIRNALIYGLSIIGIYVGIGLLITGVFGVTALQDLSTNWLANTIFFAVFVFFAFSFFGYYEITLPSSWTNKSDSMADKGGIIGIFFMAFTLALVSFSCTGPIIGSALVQSATDTMGPFTVMLGFSSALALPFGLFAAFPAWLNSLPKSGGWMNSVKVVLGFLELALALKFLSVADMTMHWGVLPYEVFLGLWIAIFAGMTLYLFGLIRFPHDSPMKKLSPTRGFFAVGALALTAYLCMGFVYSEKKQSYDSLKLMSGLAPPAHYNILLPDPDVDAKLKARFPSYTKCANNLDCFKNYQEGLTYANEVQKPILLDFTGYGCVNCRKTEEHIWVADNVWSKIQQDFVLVSLYTDDREKLEKMLISKHRNEKLRTVGSIWQDFQIVNFEQNSQPLYVMLSPDQKVLAAPRGYQEGIDGYAEFLNCGNETFKSYQSSLEIEKPLGSN
ncbi:MAG: thiol:disulfide interchange protein [Saprospiraceae bacterium]|nr:MAG: thiol:disulfide interchange protein [Saprospiraceae bacterium]